MGRSTQFIRQWTILRALVTRHYGLTICELARDLNVSTRTIRRDLQCLEQAGFPVYVVTSEDGIRWKMRRDHVTTFLVTDHGKDGESDEN